MGQHSASSSCIFLKCQTLQFHYLQPVLGPVFPVIHWSRSWHKCKETRISPRSLKAHPDPDKIIWTRVLLWLPREYSAGWGNLVIPETQDTPRSGCCWRWPKRKSGQKLGLLLFAKQFFGTLQVVWSQALEMQTCSIIWHWVWSKEGFMVEHWPFQWTIQLLELE